MTADHDLVVVGGGLAGASAAIEAARLGLDTLLLDEATAAGGQVQRAPAEGLVRAGHAREARVGSELRRALAESGATCAFSQRVWCLERGFKVLSIGDDGSAEARSKALILATGATERNLPIPGWTLPGVLGLAAATLLLKSQALLPGRRVVVAGSGPLLPLVAASILEGGGEVAAVVDAAPRRDWLKRMPSLLTRPDLLAKGATWLARLVAAGVPVLSGHVIASIQGNEDVQGVSVIPLDAAGGPRRAEALTFACDAVCYGYGLLPSTEATRLLAAEHVYSRDLGGWSATTDADQRTSVPLLYAAGDGAGVLGAAAAPLRGRLAALAAARDLGRLEQADFERLAAPLRKRLVRASSFGRQMTAISMPKEATSALMTPETIVCRCEGVTRAVLDTAIRAGAVTMNGLKATTRCGMGPCGGRVCSDATASIIAAATGRLRNTVAEATGRPPLRPIPLAHMAAGLRYEDLPIPTPAPL